MRKQGENSDNKSKRTLAQFILMIIIAVVSLGVFFQSSFFDVSRISVTGTEQLKVNEVVDLANIQPGVNLLKVNINEVSEKLKINPWIHKVEVKRNFPSTLEIAIKEHLPIAYVETGEGYAIIEEYGGVLKYSDSITSTSLPIITGVEMPDDLTYGESVQKEKLLKAIKVIIENTPDTQQLMSEINISESKNLTVFLTNGIQIKVGDVENSKIKMKKAVDIIKELKVDDIENIAYIDLRFNGPPIISYGE